MENQISKAEQLLKEGKNSEAQAAVLTVKQYLNSEVPYMIEGYMAGAKTILIEAKMLGKDISRAIGLVKEAKSAVERKDIVSAVEYLTAFKKDTS